MRRSTIIRAAARGALAAGIAAPLVRRRLKLPRPVVTAAAAATPVALCVLFPRSRARDVLTCGLQMWAYTVTYQMPADDAEALERRVHVDYPIRLDSWIGFGKPAGLRLQSRFSDSGRVRRREQALVWAHWLWFAVPHGAVAYVLWKSPERFPRAAALTYGVFDIGLIGYWAVPTAPPWYAAQIGRLGVDDVRVRRLMVEHGREFWHDGWDPLYSLLGGNPLAAMPSLHFATSLMAAHLLSEMGAVESAVGWGYALTLGFALVYLGEHYVVDLLAGAALTESVRAAERPATPIARALARAVGWLEAEARPA